ncbi:MAG: NDP-sugar synthase [Candidatus Lokiarchaeota archaeon]|nr:NDP-sugar synthase [Candidatus Lokiarchaeota archaeon]
MVKFSKEIIPVVILAGGRGTRLQPISDVYPKALIPIAGKPLIERVIDLFSLEGFRQFIIVTNPDAPKLTEYIDSLSKHQNTMKFVHCVQREPLGMGNAILCASESIIEALSKTSQEYKEENIEPFFILSAVDILLDSSELSQLITAHLQTKSSSTLALYYSTDSKMSETHGNVKLKENLVLDMVEKPGEEKKIDDFYSIPLYIFSQKMLDYLPKVEKSTRNEWELPSAIKLMLLDKHCVRGVHLLKDEKITLESVGRFHLTHISDIPKMTFRFLHGEDFEYEGEYPTLIEPVAAKLCKIGDSVLVGPEVYIGEKCDIGDYSEISRSVLLGNNKIGKYVRIENAIIARNVEIPDMTIIKDTLIMENDRTHNI